jgi:hypothetical protein
MENLKTLNKLLKNKGLTNKEVTRQKKDYYLLHICKNNNPVPLIITENPLDIKDFIKLHY